MTRKVVETFLGKRVEIELDRHIIIIRGIFHKTGEEQFKNNPNLYIPKNYYFCEEEDWLIFRSSHIRKIKEIR